VEVDDIVKKVLKKQAFNEGAVRRSRVRIKKEKS